jgi:hypothetical protein
MSKETTQEASATNPPGWYRQGSCIRWWDGEEWTTLTYPKKWGITWGGGTYRNSFVAGVIAVILMPLFYGFALLQFHGGLQLAGWLLCVCVAALIAMGSISFANAYYVKVLQRTVAAYADATGVRPPT